MIPTIEQFMTPAPHCIDGDRPLSAADELMRAHGVRHLPVRRGDEIVGLVSRHDLDRAEAARDTRRLYTPISDVMQPAPFEVAPEAHLTDVVRMMAENRWGAALVRSGERIVGIFTSVDAARVLADLVEQVTREDGERRASAG